MVNETYCSCCGVANSIYNQTGHNKEEMYHLAEEWLVDTAYSDEWNQRYNLIVDFLLEEVDALTKYRDSIHNAIDSLPLTERDDFIDKLHAVLKKEKNNK